MFKTPYFSLLFWAILVFYPAAAQVQQPDEATLKWMEYHKNEDYEGTEKWQNKEMKMRRRPWPGWKKKAPLNSL